jgi:hypothetical protein
MSSTHNADGSDIIHKLLQLIDTYCGIGAKIRDLLLELARWMDETEQCQQDEICRKIKHILKEKIDQRKISERWIEDSLPQEYKRQYTKSELSSVSKENKQEQVLSIETRLEENELLNFQISIPANDVWDFIIDYSPLLDREKMNHLCVDVVFNKRTEEVVSARMKTL